MIAFQFQKSFRNRQFAGVLHGMRHVIKLRRIVDGAKETGEVVKERFFAAADKDFDFLSVRRGYRFNLIGVDGLREITAWKTQEGRGARFPAVSTVTRISAALKMPRYLSLIDSKYLRSVSSDCSSAIGPRRARRRDHLNAIQHIGVEDARIGSVGHGKGDDHFFTSGNIGRAESEEIVQIRCTYVDVGKNRIYRIRIIVVSQENSSMFIDCLRIER